MCLLPVAGLNWYFGIRRVVLKKNTMSKNYIISREIAEKKMERMAYEILENNMEEKEIILAGIADNGSILAANIQRILSEIAEFKTRLISIQLDKRHPAEIHLSESMDFNDRVIVVIDDVANSGKTMLYAMKPFLAYHPRKMQTLALVERTHKSFPVKTDYVGISVATTLQEHIFVEVKNGEIAGAYME
jgi:pyrimidine operon attenuation protein/uracil phosphoribosyltransferase